MKPFARRSSQPKNAGAIPDGAELLDLDELDIAPLGSTEPAAPPAPATPVDAATAENDEFVERLGDLDRFIGTQGIGGASTASTSWGAPSPTRNLPAAPTPAVAPISHPRPPAPERVAAPTSESDPAGPSADTEDEAQEFLDRLSDLDRFIGGTPTTMPAPSPAPAPAPAPAPTAGGGPSDTDDEAQEFLDRLGDLDRFIGGHNTGGGTPPEQ